MEPFMGSRVNPPKDLFRGQIAPAPGRDEALA
jgi:hypothetical protein